MFCEIKSNLKTKNCCAVVVLIYSDASDHQLLISTKIHYVTLYANISHLDGLYAEFNMVLKEKILLVHFFWALGPYGTLRHVGK